MELFLPSLFIFLLATIVITFIVPRMSPIIIAVMAAALLAFGVYHHFTLFWNEYKQSTWQDQLKLFAPGIMLAIIIVYVLFSIVMFFTGGSVPIPSMPEMVLPSANTATNRVTSTLNNIIQPLMPNNNKDEAPRGNNSNALKNNSKNNNKNNVKDNGKNNVTRSFLATI